MPSTSVTVTLDLEDIGLEAVPGVPLTVAPRTSTYLGASQDKALDLDTSKTAVTNHLGQCSVSVIKSSDIVFGDTFYVVTVGNFEPFIVELNADTTVRDLVLASTPSTIGATEAAINSLIAQYLAEHGGGGGTGGLDTDAVNRLITEALVSVRAAISTNTSDISSLTTVVTANRQGLASLEGRFDAIAPDNSSLDSNERYLAAVLRGGNIVPYWDRSRQVPIAGRVGFVLTKTGENDNDYEFREATAGGATDQTARGGCW